MRRIWKLAGILFLVLLIAYLSLAPSNTRDWSPDQAVLSYGVREGDLISLYNIRNFTYRSTTDYDTHYYNHTYNLSQIRTVDYAVEPFSFFQGIAHTFFSFGFEDGSYVAISVEIRKEKGEVFSPLRGLFRQYELMYVIGDEQDLIKLRTNYRNDEVYLYPLKLHPDVIRAVFLDMIETADTLQDTPAFYNTITESCSIVSFRHLNRVSILKVPVSIKLVLPGYSDRYIYDIGLIEPQGSFEETRTYYNITGLARAFADDPQFSQRIRQHASQ